jgi:hypothetical protein
VRIAALFSEGSNLYPNLGTLPRDEQNPQQKSKLTYGNGRAWLDRFN